MRRSEEQIAIYSRKSKFTGKGESIGNQVELCKEYVRNMFGEEYVDRCVVFEDEGFSGGNLQRPDFKRMMEEVRKRKFKAIVVYRLDRISRNISDFTGLIDELTKLDVSFVSIKEQFDTSTPMGRAMMFIISVFSQLERETIAERIRDNMHELAKTGRWLGGNTPTGFKSGSVSKITIDGKERKSYKLIPIPEEIEIPKMIFDLYIETDSLTAVEAELLRQRIKTKQGKDFTRFAIKAILQNPVYMVADEDAYNYFIEKEAEIFFPKEAFDGSCGIMAYNRTNQEKGRTTQLLPVSEWIIAIGRHPGFIPSKQWIKVQESLDRNKSKAYRKPRNNEALLTGLVYCSCGERMYPKLSQRKTASGEVIYTYVCKMKERSKRERCNRRNANGNILDAAIIEQIKSLTDHDSSFIAQLAKSREFYTGKREQYERQLEELRVEHEMNEKTINGLIDSLGMVGDSIAKPRVLKRIEELSDINRDVENRIHELEGLVNVNSLTDAEFDLLRQMLSMFRTGIDDMSIEEKRAAIRTVVRKVIWDGVNAHVVLFGADESDIEFPDMDDRLAHMDDESGEEEPLEAFADVDYGDFEEDNSGLGKNEPSNASKSRWGEDRKINPTVFFDSFVKKVIDASKGGFYNPVKEDTILMLQKIRTSYEHTIYASYIGYITQAIVNNFAPLLFLTFATTFDLTLDKIAIITTVNFTVQLIVDFLSAKVIDKLGYRAMIVAAHVFAASGLIGMAILPEIMGNAYAGILVAVVLYAVGGGIIEVLISPIVEACPTKKKEAAMSLLHSFYCWGHVGVVLVSTLFFTLFGVENWRVLACIWAIVPIINMFYFMIVPIYPIVQEHEKMAFGAMLKQKVFWILMILMVCAGASEQAMSQWASAFAESALHVSKTVGDLMGPCIFAVLMGTSRAIYGKYSDKIPLKKMMAGCALLCIVCYLMAILAPRPIWGLTGCAICGFSVGIFWPGTFSLAAAKLPGAGTAMYALMALAGDVGCSSGPTLVGIVANQFDGDLQKGLIGGIVFPVLIFAGMYVFREESI